MLTTNKAQNAGMYCADEACAMNSIEVPSPLSPIEERAQQLEKELLALSEVVDQLSKKLDRIMMPDTPPTTDVKIGTPTPVTSALTRAFDYAVNSVVMQRIALAKLIDRIEL